MVATSPNFRGVGDVAPLLEKNGAPPVLEHDCVSCAGANPGPGSPSATSMPPSWGRGRWKAQPQASGGGQKHHNVNRYADMLQEPQKPAGSFGGLLTIPSSASRQDRVAGTVGHLHLPLGSSSDDYCTISIASGDVTSTCACPS